MLHREVEELKEKGAALLQQAMAPGGPRGAAVRRSPERAGPAPSGSPGPPAAPRLADRAALREAEARAVRAETEAASLRSQFADLQSRPPLTCLALRFFELFISSNSSFRRALRFIVLSFHRALPFLHDTSSFRRAARFIELSFHRALPFVQGLRIACSNGCGCLYGVSPGGFGPLFQRDVVIDRVRPLPKKEPTWALNAVWALGALSGVGVRVYWQAS